jgi:uncharacterized membrane protein YtjA (UPF0391 family)
MDWHELFYYKSSLLTKTKTERYIMLSWSLTFLIIAIIAAVLGFGGLAGAAAGIAKILFFVFFVLLIVSAVAGAVRGRKPM